MATFQPVSFASFVANTPSPLDTTMKGFQTMSALQSLENEDMQKDLLILKAQRDQEAKQRSLSMQADLAELSAKKVATAEDYRAIMTKYPDIATHLKAPYDAANDAQKKELTSQALNIYTAVATGQKDVAKTLLEKRVEAAKNSGNKESEDAATVMLKSLEVNPEAAKTATGLFLASTLGETEFAGYLGKVQGLGQSTPETDLDDYVRDAVQAYKERTGEEMPAALRNKARLEFKRAQANEVRAVETVKKEIDAATAERIAYNKELGNNLAKIQTAGALIDAKGEVTPREKMSSARGRMESNLAALSRHFVNLDSQSGIVNAEGGSLQNIWARTKSSSPAQAFQNAMGTSEQKTRNMIKKLRPLLLQDIRQSTDMSARGLDSNKELEFYMQAATDEKTDLQSNLAGIIVLSEAYGDGSVAKELMPLVDMKKLSRIRAEGQRILNRRKKKAPIVAPSAAPAAPAKPVTETRIPSYMKYASGAK